MTPRQFWGRYLRAYDALNMVRDYRAYLDEVARRLCRRPGELILDAGSGTGNLSMKMRNLGANVISLDFSPVALAIHRDKDPSAVQVEASLEAPLAFSNGTFDGVACTSVLFALPEEEVRLALHEFRRVLKPGGSVLVTVARERMSVLRLGWDHFTDRFRAQPFTDFLGETHRDLEAMLAVFYYSIRVRALKRKGGWRRYSKAELLADISSAGFVSLRYSLTHGGRFHMVEAVSPPSDEPRENVHVPAASVRPGLLNQGTHRPGTARPFPATPDVGKGVGILADQGGPRSTSRGEVR